MTMSDETWKWEAAELSNKERIAEMLEANWKQNETARELGISASAVCQAVKKRSGQTMQRMRLPGQRVKED